MKITSDEWLAGIFGGEVFKVTLASDGAGLAVALRAEFDQSRRRPGFYYARVPTQEVDQVRLLTEAGFGVVDVNITLERLPKRPGAGAARGQTLIREVLDTDHDELLDLAFSCFRYSRFHLDPQIPPGIADAIKKSWVFSYLHGLRGERLLVAEVGGKPVGFLCEMQAEIQGEPVGIIDLIGVSRSCQGRGIGASLVEFFCQGGYGRYRRLRVGTQAANLPSLRLYEGCGFKIAETSYILHAHVKANP